MTGTQEKVEANIKVQELINEGALFVINHSGGKDSQAMTVFLKKIVPAAQLLIVHSHLPGVEWDGIEDHIRETAGDLPFLVTQSATKTFFEMVERRGMFPSPSYRQCTSDLKRDPISKVIRAYLKEHPEFDGKVVSCMGIRAQESSARSKAKIFKLNNRESKAGREWYDWLPIHDMLIQDVFKSIKEAGQDVHWAYKAGMSRLSCCFCIMSNQKDLCTAAKLRPELLEEYDALERKVNHTMMMPGKGKDPKFLKEIIADAPEVDIQDLTIDQLIAQAEEHGEEGAPDCMAG